jgi:alpha-1,2-mannosyltransferase
MAERDLDLPAVAAPAAGTRAVPGPTAADRAVPGPGAAARTSTKALPLGVRLLGVRLRRVMAQWLPAAVVAVPVWLLLAGWNKQGIDFSVYWHGGKILNDAGWAASELYGPTVEWVGGPGLPFTYPPFAALVFSLLARLPEPLALQLFNAAGVAVAAWLSALAVRYWNAKADWRQAFETPRSRWIAAAALLAMLTLGPWRETLAFGQINILLMGLMAADLFSRNRRWNRSMPGSGFLVGVAAGIKLTPLVFGLYYVMRRDWRGLLNMGAGFASTVLLGWLLRPAESLQFWLEILPDTSRIGGAGYVDNLSIKGALLHFGVPASVVTMPWLLLSLVVVALAAAVIKLASNQGSRAVAVSATALAMLLISPVSWSHHWVWVAAILPAFAWTLRELPERHRHLRTVMTSALLISVLVFVFSPKTIGMAFDAENLDIQTPGLWIMASSAGAFCAFALLLCWLAALRRGTLDSTEPAAAEPAAAPPAGRY